MSTPASVYAACSIASNNYLAYAKVWAESFREHHPEAALFVCIVDRPSARVDYGELPFTPIFAHELGIPSFENFAFRYDILELNTAVKPYLLGYLRDRLGFDRALYFDPDILVLSRLEGLLHELDRHPVLLTPHIAEPLDNVDRPQERLLRMAGIYNLGFVAMRLDAGTERFIDWWQERLHQHCLNDLHHGLFVDQSWMDFAPAFVESTRVVRDPIYNIAYWNLPHRFLRQRNDRWEIEGRAAGFFHFSGLDLQDLTAISRHQNRLDLSDRPELLPLFEDYRRRLNAAGHQNYRSIPYAFATFEDAQIAVPAVARRMLQRLDPHARRWPNPFDPHCSDSYLEYLLEPLSFGTGRLNRVALSMWEERDDLMRAFPKVCGSDLLRYCAWLTAAGEGARAGLAPCFLAALGRHADAPQKRVPRKRFAYETTPYDATVSDTALRILNHRHLSDPGDLTTWLNEPTPGTLHRNPVITRLALILYRRRDDLQRAFPDPLGEDQAAFAHWFCNRGASEFELHADLVAPVRSSLRLRARLAARLRRWTAPSRKPRQIGAVSAALAAPVSAPAETFAPGPRKLGVNLAGYLSMDTGVGQAGRGSRAALERLGIETAEVHFDQDLWGKQIQRRIAQPEGAPFPITLLHANADETPRVLGHLPTAATSGGHVIGCWYWELSHFPIGLASSFDFVHEIWAPSRFCEAAFRPLSPVPVRWVPPCVPALQAGPRKSQFGIDPNRFTFLVCFDVRSIPERKNPLGAVTAFRRLLAEEPSRPTSLLIKVTGAEARPDWIAALREAARGLPVEVRTDSLSREDTDGLIASADALVSLHRSEGLGLLPLEALYLGKPVIATEYGGLTDFFDQETGFPVDYNLVRLEKDLGPYPTGAVWAEPDLDHATAQMRLVLQQPLEATRRAAVGRRRVDALYSVDAAARRYAQEFDRLAPTLGLVRTPVERASFLGAEASSER